MGLAVVFFWSGLVLTSVEDWELVLIFLFVFLDWGLVLVIFPFPLGGSVL